MRKTQYLTKHWKLIVHMLLKTKYFGVNNHWWNKHPSPIGLSIYKQMLSIVLIYPIMQNYHAMRMRTLSGWAPIQQAKKWFN